MRGYVIKWCSDGVWKYHRGANHGSRDYTGIIDAYIFADKKQAEKTCKCGYLKLWETKVAEIEINEVNNNG